MTDTFSLEAHPADVMRARRLRAMKTVATTLLVLAGIVFLTTTRIDDPAPWVGYVTAAAEAAMVGAIADWFAVTALFRHPLGIPIPHTALIPKSKDAIGRGLGEFVQRNFLTEEHIVARIVEADVPARVGRWLAEPTNVQLAAAQLAALGEGAIELVKDEEIQTALEDLISRRVAAIEVGPTLAKGIDLVIAEGYHETIVEVSLRGVSRIIADNRGWLRQRLGEESPWWVPAAVDDVVFARLEEAVLSFMDDLVADDDHPIRRSLTAQAALFARKLEEDTELIGRLDEMKTSLVGHPEFREWARSLWTEVKTALIAGLSQPDGELRRRLEGTLGDIGESLRTDPRLRERVERWLTTFARAVAHQGGEEAARAIAVTVERWNAEETSRRLELQVGTDLQFIRINGTIVGGIVGVALHGVVQLL